MTEFFELCHEYEEGINLLSASEKGRLFWALYNNAIYGTDESPKGNERYIYAALLQQIKRK